MAKYNLELHFFATFFQVTTFIAICLVSEFSFLNLLSLSTVTAESM